MVNKDTLITSRVGFTAWAWGRNTINSDPLVTARAGFTTWAGGGITINSKTLVTSRAGEGGIHHLGKRGNTTKTLVAFEAGIQYLVF